MSKGLIPSFATGKYEVRRTLLGQWVDGYYQGTTFQTFEIVGSLQPLTEREIQQLPEGERNSQHWKLYTDGRLRPSEEFGLKSSDRVIVYGEPYKVMGTQRWQNVDLPYFKTILVRELLEQQVPEDIS